jgi:hypothetical protein
VTFDDIKKLVDEDGGVTTVDAADLRDAQGAGRLSTGIMKKISKNLANRGLGHVPYDAEQLPTGQWEQVRVFNRASQVGEVLIAAHEPGEEGDAILREAVTGDARRLLEQVRDLICKE